MATAKPNITGRPRRWKGSLIRWALLLAVVLLAWFWKSIHSHATAEASESARIACSCRFSAGRDMASCRRDVRPGLPLGLSPVILREDARKKSVTAWVPLFSSQSAAYYQGQGCVLERWQD